MVKKYVRRRMRGRGEQARWSEDLGCEIAGFSIMVFETDDGVETGLLYRYGDEFVRYEKESIGFIK